MKTILDAYSLFLVDMDDTLFEERSYALSGFHAVAAYAARWGIVSADAWAFMQERFNAVGRAKIFNALLEQFLGNASPARVRELISVYREHHPSIALYPGVYDFLLALRSRGKVVVVTDGLASMQQRKFAALELALHVDRVVFCESTGHPKPDPASLAGIVEPGDKRAVMIGDRPDHDLALARNLGIDAIRVRTGRYRDVPNEPWQPVADVAEFALLLETSPKAP